MSRMDGKKTHTHTQQTEISLGLNAGSSPASQELHCLPPQRFQRRSPTAVVCQSPGHVLTPRSGGCSDPNTKANPERRGEILQELALQIKTHRAGGLRGGASASRHDLEEDCREGDSPPQEDGAGRLSLMCRRSDGLAPWPALAWWAATLPGSVRRGGMTVWVRVVAFATRAVLCRAVSSVAVDADSFRAAAPPGHVPARNAENAGHGGIRLRRCFAGGREQEIKEDGLVLDSLSGGCPPGVASTGNVDEGAGRVGDGHGGQGGGTAKEKGEGGSDAGGYAAGGRVVVVLLPTHRSYLDFVLVSLMCAALRSLPGLGWLRVPKVAAADGPFGDRGSSLRWFMEKLGEHRKSVLGRVVSGVGERIRSVNVAGYHEAEPLLTCSTLVILDSCSRA